VSEPEYAVDPAVAAAVEGLTPDVKQVVGAVYEQLLQERAKREALEQKMAASRTPEQAATDELFNSGRFSSWQDADNARVGQLVREGKLQNAQAPPQPKPRPVVPRPVVSTAVRGEAAPMVPEVLEVSPAEYRRMHDELQAQGDWKKRQELQERRRRGALVVRERE
jgi:hypothetical protein